MTEDKRWQLGTKFTGKNLEVALPATVTFASGSAPAKSDADPFLVGPNSYVKVGCLPFLPLLKSSVWVQNEKPKPR